MIDIHKNSRRFLSNQRHFFIDGAQTEFAEEFEVGQRNVLEAQLSSPWPRFFVQHVVLPLIFSADTRCHPSAPTHGPGAGFAPLARSHSLPSKEPNWLDLPTMMRMVVTTPNVFKQRRPEWLGPFNFFLFPMLSETFGGYPKGFDKSNFIFITPFESNRKKWSSLLGVNLIDGESYQIAMQPTVDQDKVIPDSFRILLRKYLGKPETKSLAPDGMPCTGATRGLLQRARITAGKFVPVGKETDRRWEQGEDPSMIDSDIFIFEKRTKLVIASPSERKKWRDIGLRHLMRESKLTQKPVSNALKGKGVRPRTLSIIRQTADRLASGS